MDNKKTGALIAARRQELSMTQKELAEKLNISDRTISKWERGAGFPDVSLLEPLADALGLSMAELIHGERLALEALPSPEAEQSARETARELDGRFRRTLRRLRNALAVLGVLFIVLLAVTFYLNSADRPAQRALSADEALVLCPFILITDEEYDLAELLLEQTQLQGGDSLNDYTVPAELLSINGDPAQLYSIILTSGMVTVTYMDREPGSGPSRQCTLNIPVDGSPIWKTVVQYGDFGPLYYLNNHDNCDFTIREWKQSA